MRKLTIATWNISGGTFEAPEASADAMFTHADGEEVDYFADEIGEVEPDLLCLQETHFDENNPDASQAKRLAEKLDMVLLANEAPFHESHIDPTHFLGIGMLATHELAEDLVSVQRIPLPRPSKMLYLPNGQPATDHPRWAMSADFGDFLGVTMHHPPMYLFGEQYGDEENYLLRVHFNRIYGRETGIGDRRFVMAGDFNDDDPLTSQIHSFAAENGLYEVLPDARTRKSDKSPRPDHIYARGFNCDDSGVIYTLSEHALCYARLEIEGTEEAAAA